MNFTQIAREKLYATLVGIVLVFALLCIYLSYYDVTNPVRGVLVVGLAGLSLYWCTLVPRRWRAAKRTGRYSIPFPSDLQPAPISDAADWVIEITYHSEPHTFDVDYIGPPNHEINYRDRVAANPLWNHSVWLEIQSVVFELGSEHELNRSGRRTRRLTD